MENAEKNSGGDGGVRGKKQTMELRSFDDKLDATVGHGFISVVVS